ncbi:MAG: hypothetical protein L0Y39_00250, partial [Methylococcaceae bacterium]|nr:hypothetical protein [Methylococcaceae bacterium]
TRETPLTETLRERWPRVKEFFLQISAIREIKTSSGSVYRIPVLDVEALLAMARDRVSNIRKKF